MNRLKLKVTSKICRTDICKGLPERRKKTNQIGEGEDAGQAPLRRDSDFNTAPL